MELRPLSGTGPKIPAVGLGTWGIGGGMGPDRSGDREGVEALRLGLDLGMSLIDTAEMYGGGHSEEVVGEALEGRSEKVFIASKVSPSHFAYDAVLRSARMSLKRLGLMQMDLYQLHWPVPIILRVIFALDYAYFRGQGAFRPSNRRDERPYKGEMRGVTPNPHGCDVG